MSFDAAPVLLPPLPLLPLLLLLPLLPLLLPALGLVQLPTQLATQAACPGAIPHAKLSSLPGSWATNFAPPYPFDPPFLQCGAS